MASNKWTKWVVGLSSVAVFTGLVGFTSRHSDISAASNAVSLQDVESDSNLNDLMNQWQSSEPNTSNPGISDRSGGSAGTFFQSRPQGRSSGRMSSHAS